MCMYYPGFPRIWALVLVFRATLLFFEKILEVYNAFYMLTLCDCWCCLLRSLFGNISNLDFFCTLKREYKGWTVCFCTGPMKPKDVNPRTIFPVLRSLLFFLPERYRDKLCFRVPLDKRVRIKKRMFKYCVDIDEAFSSTNNRENVDLLCLSRTFASTK